MKVLEPGHIYELNNIDVTNNPVQTITFPKRDNVFSDNKHQGTQTQEILRMTVDIMDILVDRTNHCDNCLRWEGNDRIIKALTEARRQMNLALLFHEQRVLERRMDKEHFDPSKVHTSQADGHWNQPPYQELT